MVDGTTVEYSSQPQLLGRVGGALAQGCKPGREEPAQWPRAARPPLCPCPLTWHAAAMVSQAMGSITVTLMEQPHMVPKGKVK